MKRIMILLIGGAVLSGLAAWSAMAQDHSAAVETATIQPKMALWRMDCGTVQVNQLNAFSDTRSYPGQTKELTVSCYLIRHGDQYMLWDTGLPAGLKGAATNTTDTMSATLRTTITEQLARIGVKPEQISVIGISHYHFDHIGQAANFPSAKLYIGKGDLEALRSAAPGTNPTVLSNWLGADANVEGVVGDKDIFGDGSVEMIDLPGHTPGHHGLLVNLPKTGPILLSGDVVHFMENLESNGVPAFNTNRADSLASLDRFKKLATSLNATLVIQHEPKDIAKLPAFPKAAE